VFRTYERSFNQVQESAERTIRIMSSKLDYGNLNSKQQEGYQKIIEDLQEICFLKLEST
jgi:hypothetical protein